VSARNVAHRHDTAIHLLLDEWRSAHTAAACTGGLAAVDVLRQGRVLVDVVTVHVNEHRWGTAADALLAGAHLDDITAALDLTVDVVRDELTEWAHDQYGSDLITRAGRDQLLNLVDGGDR
jgi:hypothetical protein